MISIAVFGTLLIAQITYFVEGYIENDKGWGPVWDLLMVGVAIYLLADAIKEEFFDE